MKTKSWSLPRDRVEVGSLDEKERARFGRPHFSAVHLDRYRCAVADRHLLGERRSSADWEHRVRHVGDSPRRKRVQMDFSGLQHYRPRISRPCGRVSDNRCRSGRQARNPIQIVARPPRMSDMDQRSGQVEKHGTGRRVIKQHHQRTSPRPMAIGERGRREAAARGWPQ
jgi:hypothetical protein